MKLTIADRLNLIQLLPKEASFVMLERASEARKLLIPTEEEVKKVGYKEELIRNQEGVEVPGASWEDTDYSVEIELSETILDSIVNKLKTMDQTSTLNDQFVPLYKKLVIKEATPSDEIVPET